MVDSKLRQAKSKFEDAHREHGSPLSHASTAEGLKYLTDALLEMYHEIQITRTTVERIERGRS
jgi:hypothetical protein